MGFCTRCGRQLQEDANYCMHCGAEVGRAGTAAEQPASERRAIPWWPGVAVGVGVVVVVVLIWRAAQPQISPAPVSPVASTSETVIVPPYEELSVGGVTDPGILPSSPFYFLKSIGRSLTYALTFEAVDKANLMLRYANEDVLGIRATFLQGNYVGAAELCLVYKEDFFNSLCWVVRAGKEGLDVEPLMDSLIALHQGHRLVLTNALGADGAVLSEAVIDAVTYTSAPFEYVIRMLSGTDEADKFHSQLQVDFSGVDDKYWLVIESRLGLDPRQSVALSEAMGASTTANRAPVITSVRASTTEIAPGASCDLTCAASDLEGDPITYEWLTADGWLDGSGESITWTAPDNAGLYKVTVVVSDHGGSQASKSISLRVG